MSWASTSTDGRADASRRSAPNVANNDTTNEINRSRSTWTRDCINVTTVSGKDLQDNNGSVAFVNKCDFGLVVERNRTESVTRIHVKKVKFRHLGNIGECTFVYNPVNGRYSPTGEAPDPGSPAGLKTINTKFDNGTWMGREENGAEGDKLSINKRGQTFNVQDLFLSLQ